MDSVTQLAVNRTLLVYIYHNIRTIFSVKSLSWLNLTEFGSTVAQVEITTEEKDLEAEADNLDQDTSGMQLVREVFLLCSLLYSFPARFSLVYRGFWLVFGSVSPFSARFRLVFGSFLAISGSVCAESAHFSWWSTGIQSSARHAAAGAFSY